MEITIIIGIRSLSCIIGEDEFPPVGFVEGVLFVFVGVIVGIVDDIVVGSNDVVGICGPKKEFNIGIKKNKFFIPCTKKSFIIII